jgi:hypothetical protein
VQHVAGSGTRVGHCKIWQEAARLPALSNTCISMHLHAILLKCCLYYMCRTGSRFEQFLANSETLEGLYCNATAVRYLFRKYDLRLNVDER